MLKIFLSLVLCKVLYLKRHLTDKVSKLPLGLSIVVFRMGVFCNTFAR